MPLSCSPRFWWPQMILCLARRRFRRRDAEGPESTAEMYNLTKRNNEIKESRNERWSLSLLLLLSLMTELRMEHSHSSLISLINYIIFYFLVNSHVSIVRKTLPPITAGPELVKWRRRSISVHTLIAIHRTLRISGDLTSCGPLPSSRRKLLRWNRMLLNFKYGIHFSVVPSDFTLW